MKCPPPPPTAGMEVMMDKKNVMEGRQLDFVEKQHDDKKEILSQYLELQARRAMQKIVVLKLKTRKITT
jgi:hypothetical protein